MLNICLFLIVQTSERSWDQRQTNSGSSENGWSSTESKQQTQKSLEEFRFSLVQFQWAGNEVKSRCRTNQNSLKHVMLTVRSRSKFRSRRRSTWFKKHDASTDGRKWTEVCFYGQSWEWKVSEKSVKSQWRAETKSTVTQVNDCDWDRGGGSLWGHRAVWLFTPSI